MADKTYRRDWAQAQALAKLREMRGAGMSDVKIGAVIGGDKPLTGVFVGAMLRDKDPKPVSERVWDGLILRAGFKPRPPDKEPQTGTVRSTSREGDPKLLDMLDRQMLTIERLTQAVLDQGEELTRLRQENAELRGHKAPSLHARPRGK